MPNPDGSPTQDELNKLSESQRQYYQMLLGEQDVGGANSFVESILVEQEATQKGEIPPPEVLPTLQPKRVIPGLDEPGSFVPAPEMEAQVEAKEQFMAGPLIIPELLDQASQDTYNAAVDRYKSEGFPSEEDFGRVFEAEFNMIFENEGKEVPVGFDLGNQYYGEYILRRDEYVSERMPPETAESKAKEEVFGVKSPRKPRAISPFAVQPTPVTPGLLQQNPELQAEMSTAEVAKQALAPQTISSGDKERRRKAIKQVQKENYFDTIDEVQSIIDLEMIENDEDLMQEYNQLIAEGKEESARRFLKDNVGTTFEEAQPRYFQAYYDSNAIQIIVAETGADPGLVAQLYATDSLPMIIPDQDEREAVLLKAKVGATRLVRQHIHDMTGYSEDDKRYGKDTPREAELKELFPRNEEDSGILEDLKRTGVFALENLTTTRYDPAARQRFFEMGITNDPDAITETAGMAIVRDINLPLRAVVNPAISGLENLGVVERFDADEEVETILPAKRVELTEDAEGLDVVDAYLREILVETATMRTLGNDLGQMKNIAGIEVSDGARDYLVGAGTVAELFVPLVPGGKILSVPSRAAGSLLQKTAVKAGTKLQKPGLVKAAPIIREGTEFLVDTIGSGGNLVYPVARGAKKLTSKAARTTPITQTKLRAAGAAGKLDNGDILADAIPTNRLDDFVTETATVKARVADELADQVIALEARALGGDADDIADLVADGQISQRSADRAMNVQPEEAGKLIDDMVQSGDDLLVAAATSASKRSRNSFELFETGQLLGNPSKSRVFNTNESVTNAKIDTRNAVNEKLLGFGLGDYVLVTDRIIASDKKFRQILPELRKFMADADGKSAFFEADGAGFRIKSAGQDALTEAAKRLQDPYLQDLIEAGLRGEILTTGEMSYATNRLMDDFILQSDAGAFVATDTKLIERATEPLERRTGPIRFAQDVIQGMRGTSKMFDKAYRKVTDVFYNKAPDNLITQTQENAVATSRFKNQVDDNIGRMERTVKGAFGNVARNSSSIGARVKQLFPEYAQRLMTTKLSERGTQVSAVHETVFKLQAAGKTMDEISLMSADEIADIIETDAGKLTNFKQFEQIVGQFFDNPNVIAQAAEQSSEARAALQAVNYTDDWNVEKLAKVIGIIRRENPTLALRAADSLEDVIASNIIQIEATRIVNRALKENFATDALAFRLDEGIRNLDNTFPRPPKMADDGITVLDPAPSYAEIDGFKDAYLNFLDKAVAETVTGTGFSIRSMLDSGNPMQTLMRMPSLDAFEAQLTKALQRGISVDDFLDAAEGGYVNQLASYVDTLGVRFKVQDPAGDLGIKLRRMGDSDIIRPMSAYEQDAINNFMRKFESGDTQISDNFAKLERRGTVGDYAINQMNYYVNGLRRTFVSGQLGGKYLPNIPYQAENLMTAPIIAYVTNPKYVSLAIGQIPQTLLGLTPYRKLRYMAAAKPDAILPGTGFTYRQVYTEFTRRNLGVSNAGLNLGDSFYRDLSKEAAGWNRFTQGVPGYQGFLASVSDKNLYTGFVDYVRRGIMDGADGAAELGRPFSPTMSPFMKWADETDRAFREAVFIRALQNGESLESAAKSAREVFLDYGMLPAQAKQGFMKATLYLSFQYASSAEMLRAMASFQGVQRVAAMANFHRQMARNAGVWYHQGDAMSQALWIETMPATDTDKDFDYVNTYMRSPYMSNLINMGSLIGFATGIYTGRSEDAVGRAKEGISDFVYIPLLDFIKELDVDYKKGVPAKQIFRMNDGIYDSQFLSLQPVNMFMAQMADGHDANYWFDRYDIEVRPTDRRVPGSPTFDGYQFRFRSERGYNTYLFDQLMMAKGGTQRGFNDYYNALVLSGFVDIPEGFDLTYQGPEGKPSITQGMEYLFLKKRPVRVPKDIEIEYRALKESLRRSEEQLRKFKK